MENKEKVHVDEKLYVNEATLELIRRRIESDIRGNFFKTISLPIGGAGIVAILLTLFVWIPDKISTIIETNPAIQENIKTSAVEYLKKSEGGQKFIKEEIEKIAKIETEKIAKEHIELKAKEYIENSTNEFFHSSLAKELLSKSIDGYLRSKEATDLIKGYVEQALKPKLAKFSEEISRNVDRLVIEIKQPFRDVTSFEKESMIKLNEFIESQLAADLKRKGEPAIALSIPIRKGQRYSEWAIREYVLKLSMKFGSQFRYVLILDQGGEFLALFPSILVLQGNMNNIMALLNSSPNSNLALAIEMLEEMFTKRSTAFIQANWTIVQALTKPIWSLLDGLDAEVAVIDGQRKFIGITTRIRMIEGILS